MERTKVDFIDVMKAKTDEELLVIVEKNAMDYTLAALEAAEEILTLRGISYKEALPYQARCFAEKYYANERRFGDYLIDLVVYYVLCYVVGSIVGIIYGIAGVEVTTTVAYIISYPVLFLYYFIMENTCGKTVGKMILGLKVVDADGNQPSVGRIALRSLFRLVPFEGISFLFGNGWEKYGGLRWNWHDQWSKTYVVDMRKVKADDAKY